MNSAIIRLALSDVNDAGLECRLLEDLSFLNPSSLCISINSLVYFVFWALVAVVTSSIFVCWWSVRNSEWLLVIRQTAEWIQMIPCLELVLDVVLQTIGDELVGGMVCPFDYCCCRNRRPWLCPPRVSLTSLTESMERVLITGGWLTNWRLLGNGPVWSTTARQSKIIGSQAVQNGVFSQPVT